MNRRSILRLLGLAPIAAPAAMAAASMPALVPIADVAADVVALRDAARRNLAGQEFLCGSLGAAGSETGWYLDLNADGSSHFRFDGQILTVPSLRVG